MCVTNKTLLFNRNLRKTDRLLKEIDKTGKKVTYYALDLDKSELTRSMDQLRGQYTNITVNCLHGTYEDARVYLSSLRSAGKLGKLSIWWLGSSIGNLDPPEAHSFVKSFADDCLIPDDTFLCGIDRRNPRAVIQAAYHDSEGVTRDFIMNGLLSANTIIKAGNDMSQQEEYEENALFNLDQWEYGGDYDVENGRHEAWYIALDDINLPFAHIRKGQHVRVERSYKYSAEEVLILWENAGLQAIGSWADCNNLYDVHLAQKPPFRFGLRPEVYAADFIPTLEQWQQLWKAWDMVTRGMLTRELLNKKPIDLRHECIFYCGHIPTFLDIQLSRALKEDPVSPKHYLEIFERGIDPNIDDPSMCHDHSIVPDTWPDIGEILAAQQRVRDRVAWIYNAKEYEKIGALRRALWLGFEHEEMHLETLLYMLVQSPETQPPPVLPRPDFAEMAKQVAFANDRSNIRDASFIVANRSFEIGMDDVEGLDEDKARYFGWDNEKPRRLVSVRSFAASNRLITCREYHEYLKRNNIESIPKSWGFTSKGELGVKTVYGVVPISLAQDWPVTASYSQLAEYASSVGGRIPTQYELRAIYDDIMSSQNLGEVPLNSDRAANNHHKFNDVHATPPPERAYSPALSSEEELNGNDKTRIENNEHRNHIKLKAGDLFHGLIGANCGFRYWHPTPMRFDKPLGIGGGGVWEWTSSELESHEGFVPSKVYPGYTADFFDKAHNVVLGASWATLPSIAGRKSFTNWYQRKYEYAFIGARVVHDI